MLPLSHLRNAFSLQIQPCALAEDIPCHAHNLYKVLTLASSMKKYPVLNEDIYFAEMKTRVGSQVKVHNTTTLKDYKVNSATAAFLDLCTGTHSLAEVAHLLSHNSDEQAEEITQKVEKISAILQNKGIITMRETPLQKKRKTKKVVQVCYPLQCAHVELTNRCNLSCLHCTNNSGQPYPDELTTEEILSLIDTLSIMGITRIVLTGGEPLLHPDLYEIINHARKAPMRVDIFTNSTLITEDHIKKFKQYGVARIATSIDSLNESIHDTFRGQKGALKRTLRGITLLQKAGFPVRVSISIAQANKDHIVDLIKYLGEHNLTDYQVAPVRFSGRGITDVVISPEEYYHVLLDELTYLKAERPSNIPDLPQKGEGRCGIAKEAIYIKADGTVLPCHGCVKDMGVGNVRDMNLVELWNENETFEMYRKMNPDNDSTCKTCEYLSFCNGCIAGAFIYEGNIRCYDPYTCAQCRAYCDVFGT